jgi:hypothetical protein
MSCPSPVVLSLYADAALAAAEARELEAHLAQCAKCRAEAEALVAEARQLRAALAAAASEVPIPSFHRPLRARDLVLLGGAVTVFVGFAQSLWSALAAAVPSGLEWLNPFGVGELVDLVVNIVIHFSFEETAMSSSTIEIAVFTVVIGMLAWGVIAARRPRGGTAALLSLLLVVIAAPSLTHAAEIRRGNVATVAAGETVDDTLIAIGENVAIDGNVTGDLIAFARRVTIRGSVGGDVIGAGRTVIIEGPVGGNVFGFGETVTLGDTMVARNLYGFGRTVTIGSGASVGGNATTFAAEADISGRVGVDLLSFGDQVSMSGNVQRNVDAYGSKIAILPPGHVGGNVTGHVADANDLTVATGATVAGKVATDIRQNVRAARRAEEKPYLTTSFYVRQAVRLGAAFLTGLLLLWVFPGLRTLPLSTAAAGVKAGGVGLIAAVMLPVAALIACITIFGIPIGILGFVLWLLGLYFAKIVVAQIIGRSLFKSPAGLPHYAATLIAGLVIVVIAINLPWIGWLVNLVATCVGLGLLVLYAAGSREHLAA